MIRWIDAGAQDRGALIEMLTKALPAVVLSASDEDVAGLVALLTREPSGP